MRITFFLGYGLLPVWAALAFIVYGFMTMRPDHAGMTLWALAPAIPACAVTLLVAGSALLIESRTSGDRHRKLRVAATFVAGASLLLILVGLMFWQKKQGNTEAQEVEQLHVEEFVKSNADVRGAAGTPLRVSVASISFGRSESMPVFYDVSVVGTKTIYAIVEIDRRAKEPLFILKCTTPIYMGQRDPHKHPCAQ
jgi:hypothetical protein